MGLARPWPPARRRRLEGKLRAAVDLKASPLPPAPGRHAISVYFGRTSTVLDVTSDIWILTGCMPDRIVLVPTNGMLSSLRLNAVLSDNSGNHSEWIGNPWDSLWAQCGYHFVILYVCNGGWDQEPVLLKVLET